MSTVVTIIRGEEIQLHDDDFSLSEKEMINGKVRERDPRARDEKWPAGQVVRQVRLMRPVPMRETGVQVERPCRHVTCGNTCCRAAALRILFITKLPGPNGGHWTRVKAVAPVSIRVICCCNILAASPAK